MPIVLIYFQVEGVGPNGRMFLFKRPSLEDQNATLWNMYYSMKREKDSLREKLNYEVSISSLLYKCNVGYLAWSIEKEKGEAVPVEFSAQW